MVKNVDATSIVNRIRLSVIHQKGFFRSFNGVAPAA
jgi:hypothetical protein